MTQLAAATTVAQSRGMASADLARQLRGDLDWITMRALEKDRTRRYGSVSDLAADLHRHLDNQPVVASPPSTVVSNGKFVRRHRVGVAVAATLMALLVAFAATTGIQARRIARERDRANREAETAKAVNDFLQNDLLAQAGASAQARPDTKPDPDLKVRTALDRAAAGIEGKFEAQPLVEASIRLTIGKTYEDLGLYPEAERHLARRWNCGGRCSERRTPASDQHRRPGRRVHQGRQIRRRRSTAHDRSTPPGGCWARSIHRR